MIHQILFGIILFTRRHNTRLLKIRRIADDYLQKYSQMMETKGNTVEEGENAGYPILNNTMISQFQ